MNARPIPTYEEGELALFETGAIVFHIAERKAGLLPAEANARARAITWMFAAPNTMEPPILELFTAAFIERDKSWAGGVCEPERLIPAGDKIVVFCHVCVRLKNHADWIDARFADGFTFRSGKVIRFLSFIETQDALSWAGMTSQLLKQP